MTTATTSTVLDLLKTTKVEELAPPSPQTVHMISKTDSIIVALKKLVHEGIVSAPVHDKDGNFLGLVDALDILAYTVALFEKIEDRGSSIFHRLETESKFSKFTVGDVTDFAHNPYTPVELGSSVFDAVRKFVDQKSHRCPVVDENGKVLSILTMNTVTNFIASHPGCLGPMGKMTMKDLDIGTRPVITVEKNTRTIDAFKIMHQHRISGLGIVDQNGNLIGNLSARDIKAIDKQNLYACMYMSASSFVSKIRQDNVEEAQPAIACSPSTTFEFVIGRMAANRIHRLYVCNGFHPSAVITLRDVLAVVIDATENK